jgi:hypothetical protein
MCGGNDVAARLTVRQQGCDQVFNVYAQRHWRHFAGREDFIAIFA